MPKPKNEPIGECPCPTRGCELTCKVFKFRGRENKLQQRLAGKLYLSCDDHGRYGADGKPAAQNYILEFANLWDEKDKAARAEKPKPKSDELPPPISAAPLAASSSAPAPGQPRRSVWDL